MKAFRDIVLNEVSLVLRRIDDQSSRAFVNELTAAPNVRNVKTSLTLRNSKDAAIVPL